MSLSQGNGLNFNFTSAPLSSFISSVAAQVACNIYKPKSKLLTTCYVGGIYRGVQYRGH